MRRDEVKRGRLILKALFFRLNESAEKKSNRKWICQIISTESNTHSRGSGTLWRCTKPINFNNVMNHFLAHKRRRAIIEIMCREASKCHRKSFAVLRQNSFPVHHLAALAFVLSLLRHRDGGINFIWNDFYSTPFGSCVEMSLLTSLSYSGERVDRWSSSRLAASVRLAASMSSNCCRSSPIGHAQVLHHIPSMSLILFSRLLVPGSGIARNSRKKISANCYNPRAMCMSLVQLFDAVNKPFQNKKNKRLRRSFAAIKSRLSHLNSHKDDGEWKLKC